MSKIKLLTIAVVGLLMVNIGIVVFLFAKKPPMATEGRPPMGMEGQAPGKENGPKKIIIDRLQLDKKQVLAYEKLIEAHQVSIKLLNDSVNMAKNNLYQSLQNENPAEKDALINKLSGLQKQIEGVHYNHFAALKKLCKPDQLKAFDEITKELAGFFSSGKKNGPPPVEEKSFNQDANNVDLPSAASVKAPLKKNLSKEIIEKGPGPDKLTPPAPGQDGPGKPPSAEEIFAQMDTNKDGKLSAAEVKGPIKNDFAKIDLNGDGFISKEELEKAPKPDRQGPPPGEGGQGGPPPGIRN